MIDKSPLRNNILSMLLKKLQDIKNEGEMALKKATSSDELYQIKVKFFGKQGALTLIMKDMGDMPKEERPAFGKEVNAVRDYLTKIHDEHNDQLQKKELSEKLSKEELDLTLPGPRLPLGAKHLIPRVIDEIVDILARVGFSVRTGPFIEDDYHNFSALNIPADHPSRDMQDTFYIDDEHVLRTHTSPIQIRTMETEKPPIRILAPGGVFRNDYDASHSPHFHQIEALLVDKNVSMADLKGTISFFVKEFFGPNIKTRFRPSFFPFTEPSAEVDCSCPLCAGKGCKMCKQTGWIEIGGSGLVHPNVLKSSGLDPNEWQGFAFGFGIERMAIIKYGVNDIRLFMENDLRFLEQFPP
jgi:phenylalanyl-tRNA synthetase alpha chain